MSDRIDENLLAAYFLLSRTGLDQPLFSHAGDQLLNRPVMDEVLNISSRELAATSLALPASVFANTLFGLVAVQHYVLALENKMLRLPLSSFAFQAKPQPTYLQGFLHLREFAMEPVPESNREAYLTDHMQTFYRQTINPLLETASESAGIKPEVLWSQYGGRMRYVVDLLLEQNYPDEVNQRIRQDYDWLCGLDPAVFNLRKNPFVIRPKYVDNPWNPDKPLLLRSACCLYDQREQGEKCYSCPKLTPREREAMKEQIIKEIAAAR